jgi:hypothetical protein
MEELNKNTLKTALSKLPDYAPTDSVWAGIELQLNTTQIKELKTQLKEYNPPSFIWDNLEKELELDVENAQITEGVYFLEKNSNNEQNVRETLKVSRTSSPDSSQKSNKKQGLFRRLSIQKWAIAAAMTGLIFTVFILLKRENTDLSRDYREGSDLKYSTETVDNQLLKNDWDDAEQDYKMVEDFCQQRIAACETPAFKTLKHELDELNSARESVKNAIGTFNSDADLMIQLKNIEQERAAILKQIVGVM